MRKKGEISEEKVGVRRSYAMAYIFVPYRLIDDERMSWKGKIVSMSALRHTRGDEDAIPPADEIVMKEFGISKDDVHEGIRELVQFGYITDPGKR